MQNRELLLRRWKDPLFKKKPSSFSLCAKEYNHLCGDKVFVYVSLEKDKIKEAFFEGEGCVISMASADLLCEACRNKKRDEVLSWDKEFVQTLLGTELSLTRLKCALLPLYALKKALSGLPSE